MDAIGPNQLTLMDAYWRAANYLTVGQIYLQENPLLHEPLRPEHIKPRLLGHWGTSPGLNFIYVHLNRLIRETNASVLFMAGPGHGGPAVLASVYLEGTYSEIYPHISRDVEGIRRLFRQFSTPGGVPSHVSVPTPGSIHEGGELGYVLAHAFGAAFDHPDLIVAAVVGDGEAETGLPCRDPRGRARTAEHRAVPRPRIHRAGHDDDAVSDGLSQWHEPVSSLHRGAQADGAPGRTGGRPCRGVPARSPGGRGLRAGPLRGPTRHP